MTSPKTSRVARLMNEQVDNKRDNASSVEVMNSSPSSSAAAAMEKILLRPRIIRLKKSRRSSKQHTNRYIGRGKRDKPNELTKSSLSFEFDMLTGLVLDE